MDKQLAVLKKINKVDAPAYLFEKIKTKINQEKEESTPSLTWKWIFAAAAMLVVSLNVVVFVNKAKVEKTAQLSQVVETMQLSSSNDLYNE